MLGNLWILTEVWPIPIFGGTKAQETRDGIATIQVSFEACIDKLRGLTYDSWTCVLASSMTTAIPSQAFKDLEVMYTTVINAAFGGTTTLFDSVHLVETLFWLTRGDTVQGFYEKAKDTVGKSASQMATSRIEFENLRVNFFAP